MKNIKFKRALSFALSAVIMAGSLIFTPESISRVRAADDMAVNACYWTDVAGLESYNLTSADSLVGKIIFGQNGNGKAQKWKIAGKDTKISGDNIILYSDTSLCNSVFARSEDNRTYDYGEDGILEVYANHYGASDLRSALQGYATNSAFFSSSEQGKMNVTTVYTMDNKNKITYSTEDTLYVGYGKTGVNDYITVGTNDKSELLSGVQINIEQFGDMHSKLRTPDGLQGYTLVTSPKSGIGFSSVRGNHAVFPAFDLNLSDVLFASAAEVASPLYSGYKANSELEANTFTLRYKSYGSENAVISENGDRVTLLNAKGKYLMVQNSDGVYVAAIDSDRKIIKAGDITMDNALYNFDNCKVWVESTNTDRITTAKMAIKGAVVGIINPTDSHVTLSTAAGNGAAAQVVGSGLAITPVVYTADAGYYFPSDYKVFGNNGIVVTRNSDTQITVSGTPTAEAEITLSAAALKTFTITADVTKKDFGTAYAGYDEIKAQTVTVKNTGNQTVNLSKNSPENFVVSDLSAATLEPDMTATFTIKPNTGLMEGTYEETVTVSTENGTKVVIPVSFAVKGKNCVAFEGIVFDLDEESRTAKVIGYSGDETIVIIPVKVNSKGNDYEVSGIGNGAFKDCKKIKQLLIPRCVDTFEDDIFDENGRDIVIECYDESPAMTYARDNGISYKIRLEKIPQITQIDNRTGDIIFYWTGTPGAEGYNIYRQTKGGIMEKIATLDGDSQLLYADEAVEAGTEYFYTVEAFDEWGTSLCDEGRKIARLVAPKIALTNTTSGITIKWEAAELAGRYIVYRKIEGKEEWTEIAVVAGQSFRDENVEDGVKYLYSVRTARGNVISAYSGYRSIVRMSEPQFKAENVTAGMKLTWNEVHGATQYYILRKANNQSYWVKVAAVEGSCWIDENVYNGSRYQYTVKAVSGFSVSAFHSGKTRYRITTTAIIELSNNKAQQAIVRWNGNAKATGYDVRYATALDMSDAVNVSTVSVSAVGTTLRELEKGKCYYVQVRSVLVVDGVKYYGGWSVKRTIKITR